MHYLIHTAPKLSFAIDIDASKTRFLISFHKPIKDPLTINAGPRYIEGVLPSCDGSIILVLFEDNNSAFYDTLKAIEISADQVHKRKVTFHQ